MKRREKQRILESLEGMQERVRRRRDRTRATLARYQKNAAAGKLRPYRNRRRPVFNLNVDPSYALSCIAIDKYALFFTL